MEKKGSTGSILTAYRKRRQQSNIIFVYGAAGLLVLAGVVLLIIWLTGPSKPLTTLFATDTPTPTLTFTPTIPSLPPDTPTITPTATETATMTPSGPFTYTVQEGDSLAAISDKFGLGDNGIPLILLLNQYNPDDGTGIDPTTLNVYPGQEIWLPNPDLELPTATPIPADIPRGTKIPYVVQAGDSLAGIASKFNSIVDEIVKANNLEDANSIFVGQTLQIPVNLVTPTATRPPTSTPRTPGAPLASVTPGP